MEKRAEQPSILSEKTLIPLSMLFLFSSVIYWATSIWFKNETNAEQIKEVKAVQIKSSDVQNRMAEKIIDKLEGIEKRLTRIEERTEWRKIKGQSN